MRDQEIRRPLISDLVQGTILKYFPPGGEDRPISPSLITSTWEVQGIYKGGVEMRNFINGQLEGPHSESLEEALENHMMSPSPRDLKLLRFQMAVSNLVTSVPPLDIYEVVEEVFNV